MCGCCSPAATLDLAQEALAAEGGRQLRPEHLDGDLAVVLQVVGEVDHGHAAAPELALEAVLAGKGVLQVGEEVHGLRRQSTPPETSVQR